MKRAVLAALCALAVSTACAACTLASSSATSGGGDDWVRPVGDKSVFATNPTGKRGLCFKHFNQAEVNALSGTKSAGGNSLCWVYNWEPTLADAEYNMLSAKGIEFIPMQWGLSSSESLAKLRAFYTAHTDCKYLLGYNEPNLGANVGGSGITPKRAAADWPKLEAIAEEFGLKLVSPALQYSGDKLSDGKVYGTPEAWMDEFIKEYQTQWNKDPRFDYLALHCYMNWPDAVSGYCENYADMYGKQIWLTEFCAWEYNNGGQNESMAAQTSSMQEKLSWLDKSGKVAKYAWFMSHGNADAIPYNSLFTKEGGEGGIKTENNDWYNTKGTLTDLGKAYLAQ